MVKQITTPNPQAENAFRFQETYEGVSVVAQGSQEMPGTATMRVAGYIDSMNTNFFQRCTAHLVEKGFIHLALDLHDVGFVASTEIGAFVALLRNVQTLGGSLILVGMQSRVLEVLQLLGFASFFEFAQTTEEAVALMKKGGAQPAFPKIDMCPICMKRVRLTRSGRFRCPQCKTVLTVGNAAEITL